MNNVNRLTGGLVNRNKPLTFSFDGKSLQGFEGDTLASALLANGQRLMGRSFKYHRPRGPLTSGSEEPNALVELRNGAHQEPNTRATVTELYEGLEARSQNRRGSLKFDLMSFTDLMSPFLTAGFYYKTFMWPAAFWEKLYEPIIRASAGLGSLSKLPDPDCYDKGYKHCDLLIIGAGPAGLTAAITAGRAGLSVILADEDFALGGRLLAENQEVDGMPGAKWAAQAQSELNSLPNVTLMSRSTVYGAYDHGVYGVLERKTDHLATSDSKPRQILWRIYSKRALLCAGAHERPIAFGNNDRPGIMLAGAVRAYVNRWGVAPGKRTAIFTNNDDGWRTASDLAAKGVEITAIIDSRDIEPLKAPSGTPVVMGGRIVTTTGYLGLKSFTLARGQTIEADCLAVSGGWNPAVHLTCHQRGIPIWRDDIAAFVPGANLPTGMSVTGSAKGTLTLGAILKDAAQTATSVATDLGAAVTASPAPSAQDEPANLSAYWHVTESKSRAWLDFQNDVTVKDVKLAHREGFRSVEHLKRYTTMGMATDQGKTSNIPALAIMAELQDKPIPEVGTTIFRPPYTPVPLGALAGRARGRDFRPIRQCPSHNWATEQGAVFVEVGMWLRPQYFPKPGETTWRESVDREVLAVRNSVGICDVTTLGKIDIQGPDAATFLNKIYANAFAKLAVGKTRYGLMLRPDGIAYDDGTTARLSENHFVMTTTTANAVLVMRNLEFARQCLWPGLDVQLISATEQWAQYAVAGPNARKLLQKIVKEDISNEAFPFMACGEITVQGIPGRLFRISFSGELAFEVAVPTRYGDALVRALMQAGQEFNAVPYGTEALGVMRIEKGHAAGNELNGQTTAQMLGLGSMVSTKKDSIGATLAKRDALVADTHRLVGFKPVDPEKLLIAGAHFLDTGVEPTMDNDLGWMTSVAYSPSLGHSIGLGFIKDGPNRMGQRLRAVNLVANSEVEVEITSAHFIDPEGERVRA